VLATGGSTAGELCGKAGSLNRLTAEPGGRFKWLVVTGCGSETAVELVEFTPGNTPTCQGPATGGMAVLCSNKDLGKKVGTHDTKYITCKIPKNMPEGCWSYKVKVNGRVGADPELEIREPRYPPASSAPTVP